MNIEYEDKDAEKTSLITKINTLQAKNKSTHTQMKWKYWKTLKTEATNPTIAKIWFLSFYVPNTV